MQVCMLCSSFLNISFHYLILQYSSCFWSEGKYIAFGVWVHAIPHVFRWLSQGNINLLWNSTAGLTGLIAISVIPLIAFAMMYLKRKLNYEIRKGLHYLFYVFAIVSFVILLVMLSILLVMLSIQYACISLILTVSALPHSLYCIYTLTYHTSCDIWEIELRPCVSMSPLVQYQMADSSCMSWPQASCFIQLIQLLWYVSWQRRLKPLHSTSSHRVWGYLCQCRKSF